MKASIDFLNSIGHSDKVYVRCLPPKNTPLSELEARGMTWKDKSGKVKKSTVDGYINLQTGEFYRRYGKDYKPVTDGWGHLRELNRQGYGVYFVVGHGGEKNDNITHGTTLFHESDKATLEEQQLEIDRISSEYRLQNEFPTQFIKLYFTEGLSAAEDYYQEVRRVLASGDIPVEDLTITRKISTSEKNLVELGIGKPGDRVSYWYKRFDRYHSKTGRPLKPLPNAKRATKAVETNSGEYWSDYYVTELDEVYRSILGIEEPRQIGNKQQLKLDLKAA